MTLTQILDMARNQYNAVGDTFFSDAELLQYCYAAAQELAREALVIESVDTSITSTASTQSYSYPTNVIAIKRVEYDGKPLKPVNMREDYSLSLDNSATTTTGTPQYYFLFNDKLWLRPVPDTSALEVKLFCYKDQAYMTATTDTFSVPARYHTNVVDYILSRMYAKEKDFASAKGYLDLWRGAVDAARRWQRKRLRTDQFGGVQDEESGPSTIIGPV